MAIVLNQAGVRHAVALIRAGKVDRSSPWSFDAEDGNRILGENEDWEEYSRWHLGRNTEGDPKTKDGYRYPFGKNGKLYRSALIAIRQRAGQQGHREIFEEAGRLLAKVDKNVREALEDRELEFLSEVTVVEAEEEEDETTSAWKAVLIKAGESTNGNQYSPEVLKEAVESGLFDFVPVLDWSEDAHLNPSARPSIRDMAGWVSNPKFVGESVIGTVHLVNNRPSTEVVKAAWKAGKPDMVGLSIRGSADVKVRVQEGRVVAECVRLKKIGSVDLVLNPSAGGRMVAPVAEAEDGRRKLQMLQESLEFLKEHAPDLLEKVDTENISEAEVAKLVTEAAKRVTERKNVSEGDSGDKPIERVLEGKLRELNIAESRANIARGVAESGLPEEAQKRVRKRLTELAEAGTKVTEEMVAEAIKEEREYLAKLVQPHIREGSGLGNHISFGMDDADKRVIALARMFFEDYPELAGMEVAESSYFGKVNPIDWKGITPYRSIKQAYLDLTGDTEFRGTDRLLREMPLFETAIAEAAGPMTTSSFPNLLANVMHKRMLREYLRPDLNNWRKLVRRVTVSDLKQQTRIRVGGFGNVPTVSEGAAYTDLGVLGEERVQWTPSKYGGTAAITIETIINDDTDRVRRIPRDLGIAAANTINDFVEAFIVDNPTIYDGNSLFDASNHNNLGTSALSETSLSAGWLAMATQTETLADGSTRRLAIRPRYLLIHPALRSTAYSLVTPAAGVYNDVPTFAQDIGLQLYELLTLTDTDAWYLMADPRQWDTIEIGFLGGRDVPELWVQDRPTEGAMFSNDVMTFKVRFWIGGAVTEYRTFYAGIPS